MNIIIAIAPFTAPFDISMFLVMRTKIPIATFFLYVQNGDL